MKNSLVRLSSIQIKLVYFRFPPVVLKTGSIRHLLNLGRTVAKRQRMAGVGTDIWGGGGGGQKYFSGHYIFRSL
jgi:hypothetical protein